MPSNVRHALNAKVNAPAPEVPVEHQPQPVGRTGQVPPAYVQQQQPQVEQAAPPMQQFPSSFAQAAPSVQTEMVEPTPKQSELVAPAPSTDGGLFKKLDLPVHEEAPDTGAAAMQQRFAGPTAPPPAPPAEFTGSVPKPMAFPGAAPMPFPGAQQVTTINPEPEVVVSIPEPEVVASIPEPEQVVEHQPIPENYENAVREVGDVPVDFGQAFPAQEIGQVVPTAPAEDSNMSIVDDGGNQPVDEFKNMTTYIRARILEGYDNEDAYCLMCASFGITKPTLRGTQIPAIVRFQLKREGVLPQDHQPTKTRVVAPTKVSAVKLKQWRATALAARDAGDIELADRLTNFIRAAEGGTDAASQG